MWGTPSYTAHFLFLEGFLFYFLRDFIYLFICLFIYLFILDRGEGREKGRETSMCGCLSHAPYWGPGLAWNLGMFPDWESKGGLIGSQASIQSTEPHQPEQGF